MSDYMFMLESHLNSDQTQAVSQVREAAEQANVNLFLTGGAMRDMMAGHRIRDLDFTIEGPAVKFAKSLENLAGAEVLAVDDLRKSVEMRFGGQVYGSISMARQDRYPRPGSKPQVQPATIHEDLRGRDFTVDAIALSLGKASRGLLLDPTNGLGDLAHKELRAVSNYALYDDPSRLFRLIRLRTRLGFTVEERTMAQFRNVRDAKLEAKVSPAVLAQELKQIAGEVLAGEILKALDEEHILYPFSPALAGAKLNLPAFAKLHKAQQSLPAGLRCPIDYDLIFLSLLLEKLTPKERSQLVTNLGIDKAVADSAQKLEARVVKFERELAAAKLHRPSALYNLLSKMPGEVLVYALMHSGQRIVLDRVKNYFQKYLPTAQEITERDVIEQGGQPGTPKYDKLYKQLVTARLDDKPKKDVVEEPP